MLPVMQIFIFFFKKTVLWEKKIDFCSLQILNKFSFIFFFIKRNWQTSRISPCLIGCWHWPSCSSTMESSPLWQMLGKDCLFTLLVFSTQHLVRTRQSLVACTLLFFLGWDKVYSKFHILIKHVLTVYKYGYCIIHFKHCWTLTFD